MTSSKTLSRKKIWNFMYLNIQYNIMIGVILGVFSYALISFNLIKYYLIGCPLIILTIILISVYIKKKLNKGDFDE